MVVVKYRPFSTFVFFRIIRDKRPFRIVLDRKKMFCRQGKLSFKKVKKKQIFQRD